MTTVTAATGEEIKTEGRSVRRPRWWLEIIYILVLYELYSAVRNISGSVLSVTTATQHGIDVVRLERTVHMINEVTVQKWFLGSHWFIKFLDVYYGTAHFVVTIGVLAWLFRTQVGRYKHWRNVIYATTAFALIGFIFYPLAPPRLLGSEYGFTDTIDTVGGLWNFESGTVKNISNQYAAMPSLHVAWSLWCALAIIPILKHAWSKVLIGLYPALTILAIVVTANHYWLDILGGAFAFAAGYVIATSIERVRRTRQAAPRLSSAA